MAQRLGCRESIVGIQYKDGSEQGNSIFGCGGENLIKRNGWCLVPDETSRGQGQCIVVGPIGFIGCSKDHEYLVELTNVAVLTL